MNNQLLQALMMGMGGAGGAGGGADSGAGNSPFVNGGMSPQLLQFASGALSGSFQGGVGKLMGGLLAQKMKQRMLQQQPQSGNPLDQLLSGDPGANIQSMA